MLCLKQTAARGLGRRCSWLHSSSATGGTWGASDPLRCEDRRALADSDRSCMELQTQACWLHTQVPRKVTPEVHRGQRSQDERVTPRRQIVRQSRRHGGAQRVEERDLPGYRLLARSLCAPSSAQDASAVAASGGATGAASHATDGSGRRRPMQRRTRMRPELQWLLLVATSWHQTEESLPVGSGIVALASSTS